MVIKNNFDLQSKQRELAALQAQSQTINAVRIAELQAAIHAYLSGKR